MSRKKQGRQSTEWSPLPLRNPMIKIHLSDSKKAEKAIPTLVLFSFEEDAPAAARADGFKGKELETLLSRPPGGHPAERLFFIGLGKRPAFTHETLRRAAAKIHRAADTLGLQKIAARFPSIAEASAD